MAAPLPPRRHSAVQQGSNNTNLYQFQPNSVNSSSTKQANGDLSSSMPPPPNPRTRPIPPFPIGVPVLPASAGQYVFATSQQQQQQYQQLRHTGELLNFLLIFDDFIMFANFRNDSVTTSKNKSTTTTAISFISTNA